MTEHMNNQPSTDHTQSALSIQQATLKNGEKVIWENVSFDVKPGEFIAILGPNGSGKTTLLKSILGLLELSSGTITVLGKPIDQVRNQIGFVPQQRGFDAGLPIRGRDLVEFGITGAQYGFRMAGSAVGQAVNATLKAVNAESYANKPIGQLSGGQQQRLRIAQALVNKPQLLLCDEPFLSLDLPSQQ